MNRGQVLVVVAFSIVAVVAIIGLALDVGIMFIENARLRRAVDSAALAAALQFREGYTQDSLNRSAQEFLSLNGINDPTATVDTCATDATLCTNPQRKLVRVRASGTVRLAFLPVIGIKSAPIAAEAISETASVDVVLVIDRSESMTYASDTGQLTGGKQLRDPSVCNAGTGTPPPGDPVPNVGNCEPFNTVKNAAMSFVDQLYFPYDRVAVVSFAKDSEVNLDFSSNQATIMNTLKQLTVYEGETTVSDPTGANAIYPDGNPSRCYGGDCMQDPSSAIYYGLGCPQADIPTDPNFPNPAPCTTTNIGGGLLDAGNEFGNFSRQQSLWVVVLLTDGVANAGYGGTPVSYYCPDTTYPNPLLGFNPPNVPFYCNDARSSTHHGPSTSGSYDAEDYAYDEADFIGKPAPLGQNALLFTIGLGTQVTKVSPIDGTKLGELFLQYAANVGNGLYYNAPSASQLQEIFRKIAENIATRLTH